MAPTKTETKSEPTAQKDVEKAIAGAAPDQRDAEIAMLKERLADSEKHIEKLSERAQLAEMELEDRGGAEAKVDSGKEGRRAEMIEVAAVFAAELAKVLGITPKLSGKQKPPALPEEFKGTRSYIVGPGRAFHGNRLYAKGDVITVTNQRPAKDWTPVEEGELKGKLTPTRTHVAPPTGRANDRSIG